MNSNRYLNINYIRAVLALLVLLMMFKIGGIWLTAIMATILTGFGAIYLSGEEVWTKKSYSIESIEELRELSPYEFELFVGEVFKSLGYTVYSTGNSSDGGKDLVMYKNGKTYYVECKRYAAHHKVGRPEVQKLVGACLPASALPIFVTTSRFTKEATVEGNRSGVQLIDGHDLIKLVNG